MSANNLDLRIDLVAPPFAGHLFPLLDLARRLQQRGYRNIRVLSTPESRNAVETSGLPLISLLAGSSEKVFQISDTPHRVGSNPWRMLQQLQANLSLMQELKTQLEHCWTADRADVVIADMTVPVAGLVAQSMGIHWWTSIPSPCVLETGDGTPAYLGGWYPKNHVFGRIRDAAGRGVIRTFKRLIHRLFHRQLTAVGLSSIYRKDGLEMVYSGKKIFALGVPEFEFPRSWPSQVEFIGPLTSSPSFPHQAPVFSEGKPHVLISLGTHLWWAKEQVRELMKSVAGRMPDYEFHFTYGRLSGAKVRQDGNFHSLDYFPYETYMHRYRLAVIHGGTGVLYSCLRHAVPMLVWPQDYDQFDHAARVVHGRLGLRCRPVEDDVVRDLRRLADDGEIEQNLLKMRQHVEQRNPAELVCRCLQELAAVQHGSSFTEA